MQTRLRHEYQHKRANTKSPHTCSITNANAVPRLEVQVTPRPVREIQLPSRQRSHTAEMHASKHNTCLYRSIYTTRYRKLALPSPHRLQHARSCFEAADTRYKFTATKRSNAHTFHTSTHATISFLGDKIHLHPRTKCSHLHGDHRSLFAHARGFSPCTEPDLISEV